MSDGLRERLVAATAKWRKLDSERDRARKEVLDAATAMLKAGALPLEVVALTPFSDALVRAETRKRGAPKGKRGPKRNEESKSASDTPSAIARPTTAPFKAPAMPPPAFSRENELLAIARELAEDDQQRIAETLKSRHPQMLGRSEFALATIERAIRANLVTASDLR